MSNALDLGLPRSVVSLALTMGAHGDCLVAKYDDCCPACRDLTSTAFDLRYNPDGLRPLRAVLDELWEDMFTDRSADA